jgi:hypothetical protein
MKLNKTMLKLYFTFILLVSFIYPSFSQDSLKIKNTGIYTGINIGSWLPLSKNKVLGHPAILGVTADFKLSKNALGLSFDLIGIPLGKTKTPITIKFGDSSVVRNNYSGVNITLDYGREFFAHKRWLLECIASAGYGELTYYNPAVGIDIEKKSFIISPGLSVRFLFKRKSYLQLKTQYCIANYKLNDNVSTDFSGHYLMMKLTLGAITN